MKEEWIRVIESLDKAVRKYVIELEGVIYEADHEQDIMQRMYIDYIETDDRMVQLLFRIDLARALTMVSLMEELNVEVFNGKEKIKENYAAEDNAPDYVKDYEEPDVILDVQDELTMFAGINKIGYAKVYFKDKAGEYKLF